jgi:hypothetical protein
MTCVPATVVSFQLLAEALAVLGAGGSVIGGLIGSMLNARTWRQALENLALGATVGGVAGCLIAFSVYAGDRIAHL